ncbi:MAG: hypothetical protein VX588_13715 [Verrucomicrobiota bacterium]|nr:hypothetical protein [Verrucomicrobiota bacterium]
MPRDSSYWGTGVPVPSRADPPDWTSQGERSQTTYRQMAGDLYLPGNPWAIHVLRSA